LDYCPNGSVLLGMPIYGSVTCLPLTWMIQGLDWHGPSAQDAWNTVDALHRILATNEGWSDWSIQLTAKVILLGHSNGGQGTWYMASRYPDRVIAGQCIFNHPLEGLSHFLVMVLRSSSCCCIYQVTGIYSPSHV
jgi:hypothetical protein